MSTGSYDRAAAARVLAEVAGSGAFEGVSLGAARKVETELAPLQPARGSHLTELQLSYLREQMRPCPPELVTSAALTATWRDSEGVLNVAHCGSLGAVVPVVAREATLALWRALAANEYVVRAGGALSDAARAVMAATTTDKDPLEILRVGIDTTARGLVQHAYLADGTPYATAAEFARGIRDSGIFAVVANTWFWGLQSSTFRRGMIPVRLRVQDGMVRYAAETTSILRAMKDVAIAEAVSDQYAKLPAGEQPRCLANMAVDGERLLPGVVDTFVETFVRLLDLVEVSGSNDEEETVDAANEVFEVPDMTCSHCTNTITGVLEDLGVQVSGIDLETKQVVAVFATADLREQSFEAIRGRGYTVVPRSA